MILLFVVIAVVALVLGLALYMTGGALWFGRTSPWGARLDAERRVDAPPEERVRLAGVEREPE
jgi:hypothetical protein